MFMYRARDRSGTLIAGEIEANSAQELKESLFREGMIPLQVKEQSKNNFTLQGLLDNLNQVKPEQLMVFTRQFYTLFKAGVSMDTILATMAQQMQGTKLAQALIRVRADLSSGSSLSQAFSRHPRVFNDLYISMLAAGEEAGILEQVLSNLSELLRKEFEILKNIKGAMLYPKIVIGVLFTAIGFLMTFVVPKFVDFYGRYDAELPLPTRLLIGCSVFLTQYWYVALTSFIVCMVLWQRYASTNVGRMKIDRVRFQIPIFGDLNMKVANARFGHIMAALYRSGLAMPRCLEVVARVIGNVAFAQEVQRIRDDIQKGSSLSEAMSRRMYFPAVMVETTAVGERAGALDDMLSTIAGHYDLEVDHTVKNLTTLLEPIMLCLIFGVVTVLALAIFLQIWSLSEVVNH